MKMDCIVSYHHAGMVFSFITADINISYKVLLKLKLKIPNNILKNIGRFRVNHLYLITKDGIIVFTKISNNILIIEETRKSLNIKTKAFLSKTPARLFLYTDNLSDFIKIKLSL